MLGRGSSPIGIELHRLLNDYADQLSQRIIPALRPAWPRIRGRAFDGNRWLKRQPPGAKVSLAFGVGQRGVTFGLTASRHLCSPLRNDEPRDHPVTLKRSS